MKYKVGDIVKIREDLVMYKKYDMESDTVANQFVDDMDSMLGHRVMIIDIQHGQYRIQNSDYFWIDEMFEDEKEVHKNSISVKVSGRRVISSNFNVDIYEDEVYINDLAIRVENIDEFLEVVKKMAENLIK